MELFCPCLRDKYNFVDISVFLKKSGSRYINITDFTFLLDAEEEALDVTADYLLVLSSFIGNERYAAPVTINELLILADIECKSFIKQMFSGIEDESANEIVAQLCAKKILDYAYGKVVCHDKNTLVYDFMRQKFKYDETGKRHRVYPVILTKQFKKVERLSA